MRTGIANGIYTGVDEGIEQGAYTGLNTGFANGVYYENILQNAIVRNGLILYLDASQNLSYPRSGTTWRDLTTNNNNGTLTNGPVFNSLNQGSIVFDGVNDFVSIPTPTNLLSFGTNPFTISLWIFPTYIWSGGFVSQTILSNYINYNFDYISYFYLGLINSNSFNNQITILDSNGNFMLGYTIPVNQWTNVVFTRNGNNFTSYRNGITQSTIVNISNYSGVRTNKICGGVGGTVNEIISFGGRLSQTLIYNRAITAAEVRQNYIATKSRFDL
jgi:hypothetical protein